MHDSVATFYGGYDQTGVRLPSLRIRWIQLAIAIAVVALLTFVATDVYLIDAPPPKVQVTTVNWYAGSTLVATTAGFTVHTSQAFILSETCEIFCYNFNGASVSAPFQLVNLSIVNEPVQFTNLTIRAPGGSFDGQLSITLDIGPLTNPN